ncbi:MAG: alpha-ketoglutarate-dependent dioxygenase AlkB, partial [Anderseniella sp.]|nr:alpha-ketoglutarate-dependent dioxygenase AlkB [Anderseniella sp.]
AKAAPFQQYETGRGQKMSVRMTGAGDMAWVSDRRGYRYEPAQSSGNAWPDIPASILRVWYAVSGVSRAPDSCLVNFYGQGARMGLHQDKDEIDFEAPVLSVSLGDTAIFRIGGSARKDPTCSFRLQSGDVLVMGGPARMNFHGVDRVIPATSTLLNGGGRLNLTLRRVNLPVEQHGFT